MTKPKSENRAPGVEAQVAALKKIDFLVGKWRGEGWKLSNEGKRETYTVNESVELKLGGIVALIEGLGKSKDAATGAERIAHNALGTLFFDPKAGIYRLKTYTLQGNSVDTTAEIGDKSLVWGFSIPQVGETRYTIKLTEKGNWNEIGEITRDGGKTWFKFMEMELQKVQ